MIRISKVEEARLTHLAYAPEIAQAMLRRQQAEAVIAARQKIVQGAVSMVDMALRELWRESIHPWRPAAAVHHPLQGLWPQIDDADAAAAV